MITGNRNGAGNQGENMSVEFEKWIRDTLPEPREDAIEGKINLAILRDRMQGPGPRRRRGAVRFLAVAVPLAAVIFFAGGVVDLGSDDFALKETIRPENSQPVMIKNFEGVGINVLPEDSKTDISEMVQQRAAGEAVLRRVEGWRIEGKTKWYLTQPYRIEGEEKETSSDPVEPRTELTAEIARFILGEWNGFKQKIASGDLEPTGTQTVTLDGVMCTVLTYEFLSENAGEVIYYLGGPTP